MSETNSWLIFGEQTRVNSRECRSRGKKRRKIHRLAPPFELSKSRLRACFGSCEKLVEPFLPFSARCLVSLAHGSDMLIALGRERRACIDYVDARQIGRNAFETQIDYGDHQVGQEIDILKMPRFQVKERVHPDRFERSMLNSEHSAFDVGSRLRMNELRIPMLACPGSFSLGTKQRGSFRIRRMHREIETRAHVHQ